MFHDAKNGNVQVGSTDMDYVSFGNGNDYLVMIPGLGDGLTTVKGMAVVFAIMYRIYASKYTVYVFSRKNHLQKGCTTRDMAKDTAEAMKTLGISKASVLGISQGGMIAQYLAIDYPAMVDKLVLAVTLAKQNKTMQKAVETWIRFAKQGNYKGLMIDTAEKSYSEKYLRKYRLLYPLMGIVGLPYRNKPERFNRFLIQAASCQQHNAYTELSQIICPTLVIGGDCDRVVGTDAALQLAEKIKDSKLFIYKGLGHAAYEEAKDFHKRVMRFLMK